jgi:dolichyl-phosphate-mannose--protein O-mannosyl transferase
MISALMFYLQEQIHLIGNPVIWYSAFLAVMIYLGLFVLYLMRRQRGFFDLKEGKEKTSVIAELC